MKRFLGYIGLLALSMLFLWQLTPAQKTTFQSSVFSGYDEIGTILDTDATESDSWHAVGFSGYEISAWAFGLTAIDLGGGNGLLSPILIISFEDGDLDTLSFVMPWFGTEVSDYHSQGPGFGPWRFSKPFDSLYVDEDTLTWYNIIVLGKE